MKIPIKRDVFKYKTRIFWIFTARQTLMLLIASVLSVALFAIGMYFFGYVGQNIAGFLLVGIGFLCGYLGWYKPKGGFENPEDVLKVAFKPTLYGIAQSILKTKLFEKADIWNKNPWRDIMYKNISLWEPDNLNIAEKRSLLAQIDNSPKKRVSEYEYEDGKRRSKY